MNKEGTKLLVKFGACVEARTWLRTDKIKTIEEAWQKCQRPDWMLWALAKLDYNDQTVLQLLACEVARNTPLGDGRTTWDLLKPVSRNAIEVAERFARGEATEKERSAAWAAARDAEAAAGDAAGDAEAAEAAAWAAAWAARAAARAAAGAATRDAWAAARAAGDAARDAGDAQKWQADAIRSRIPWSAVLDKIKGVSV